MLGEIVLKNSQASEFIAQLDQEQIIIQADIIASQIANSVDAVAAAERINTTIKKNDATEQARELNNQSGEQ